MFLSARDGSAHRHPDAERPCIARSIPCWPERDGTTGAGPKPSVVPSPRGRYLLRAPRFPLAHPRPAHAPLSRTAVNKHAIASLLAAALAVAGCRDATIDPGPEYPPRAQVVSGDLQRDTVADELPVPLVLRVTDQDDRPLSGATVSFVVTAGGGSVSAATVQTGASGEAATRWTLGTVAGDTQQVEARMVDPESGTPVVLATFRAVGLPDAPAAIAARPPASRTGSAGQVLADSLVALVSDAHGNPVPGVPVVWMVAAGGGTVSPATAVTGATGLARAQWTLGLQVGAAQGVDASLSPGVRAQFTATAGLPMGAALVKVSGDGQQATAGSPLPAPLVVELRTALGQPVAGAAVAFAPSAGTATPPMAVTGPDGRASTAWTLGTAAGPQALTASAEGVAAVSFGAVAAAGAAAQVAITAGNGQTGPMNAPLPVQLSVRVTDANGNPVPGARVDFTPASGGSAVPSAADTDADGVARTQWRLGPAAGAQSLAATVAGAGTVTFTATGAPGPLVAIEVTPDSVRFTALGQSQQFSARAVDAYGNTVPDTPLFWTTTHPTVATVGSITHTPTGSTAVVRPVGNGTSLVRAYEAALQGGSSLVRVELVPAAVTVVPATGTLSVGDSVGLAATVRDSGGTVLPAATVTWTTSNPDVARVSETGVVRAVSPGPVTITATSGTASGSASLTVARPFAADSIAVGAAHTCALRDGTAWCWGSNDMRQAGLASGAQSYLPVAVPGRTFASATTGSVHTCGVEADGEAYCWGSNEHGQLGTQPAVLPWCPVGVGYSVACTAAPTRVAGAQAWRQLDAGAAHTCGVTTAGAAYCWGSSDFGALGTAQPDSVCGEVTVGIRCIGAPAPVAGGQPFAQISAGSGFTCALTAAGQAWCWGRNADGQLGNGTTASSAVPVAVAGGHVFRRISAGEASACGVAVGGTVLCWGDNTYGRLGTGPTGDRTVPTAVTSPGTVAYRMVQVGSRHACAAATDDRVFCSGSNASGEVGDGTQVSRAIPGQVSTTEGFYDVGAGAGFSCGITAPAGEVYCWGSNAAGRLGSGSAQPSIRTRPAPVRSP